MSETSRSCAHCGGGFTGNARKRYCSEQCQQNAWRESTRESYTCESCGGEFTRQRQARNASRSRCRLCALRPAVSGPANVNYNGGLSFDSSVGRWRITCRDGSKVFYYRAVMEAKLGRALGADETVHHINGDPTDDRPENLVLVDRATHGWLHGIESGIVRRARSAA